MSNPYYLDFGDFLSRHFPGRKMQKLTLDAHLSCPNRDGTISRGGCAYCNVKSFAPAYTADAEADISAQIDRGRQFFARKYPEMGYLAYFQSYTNTHGSAEKLMSLYNTAISHPDIDGVIIGTRPDCIPQTLLQSIAELGSWKMIEYGAESSHDRTLRQVNRGHTWRDTADAVRRTAQAKIPVGLHLIMGLPGESTADMLATIDAINDLPVDVVKIHQLQIVRGTALARQYEGDPSSIRLFDVESYIDLCSSIVERLRPDIAIDRFVSSSPDDMLIAPRWGMKNYQFASLLHSKLTKKGAAALNIR